MSAYRCGTCQVNYPVLSRYQVCPLCEEPTAHNFNAPAMKDDELADIEAQVTERDERRKREQAFEEYYMERELAPFREQLDSWAILGSVNPDQ